MAQNTKKGMVNRMTSKGNGVKGTYKQSLKALLPYGMLATKKWLAEQGLSAHAIDNAVKTETLLLLATGVYSQYSRSVSWEGVVASMQRMEKIEGTKLHIHLYVAGKWKIDRVRLH